MCEGHFICSAGFPKNSIFPDSKIKIPNDSDLLRIKLHGIYNKRKSRPDGHSASCYFFKKITGELVAVKCNCKEFHPIDVESGKTNWGCNLSKEEISNLTKKIDGLIINVNTVSVSTPW